MSKIITNRSWTQQIKTLKLFVETNQRQKLRDSKKLTRQIDNFKVNHPILLNSSKKIINRSRKFQWTISFIIFDQLVTEKEPTHVIRPVKTWSSAKHLICRTFSAFSYTVRLRTDQHQQQETTLIDRMIKLSMICKPKLGQGSGRDLNCNDQVETESHQMCTVFNLVMKQSITQTQTGSTEGSELKKRMIDSNRNAMRFWADIATD